MKTISFRHDMIDRILAGEKVLTIRPIKPQPPPLVAHKRQDGLWLVSWPGVDMRGRGAWFAAPCKYGEPGDVLGVVDSASQFRQVGTAHFCTIRITETAIFRLDQIEWQTWDFDGCKHAGYSAHWDSFYGDTDYAWRHDPYVWVIRFELVTETAGDKL